MTNNQMQFEKDLTNKKIHVTRNFAASVEQVWRAWTESDLLDQWWAPKPYKAQTKFMDFKEGGHWLYAMVGPDEAKQWCKFDYTSITSGKRYEGFDTFCDENGNRNSEIASMKWKNEFLGTDSGSKVTVEISFESVESLNQIIEFGFQEGFTAGLSNLDELLEKGF